MGTEFQAEGLPGGWQGHGSPSSTPVALCFLQGKALERTCIL